jgi:hypothetical protein
MYGGGGGEDKPFLTVSNKLSQTGLHQKLKILISRLNQFLSASPPFIQYQRSRKGTLNWEKVITFHLFSSLLFNIMRSLESVRASLCF